MKIRYHRDTTVKEFLSSLPRRLVIAWIFGVKFTDASLLSHTDTMQNDCVNPANQGVYVCYASCLVSESDRVLRIAYHAKVQRLHFINLITRTAERKRKKERDREE